MYLKYKKYFTALFLLDNQYEIYIWQGWLPKDDTESENLATGSAKLRLDVNRKLVMEIALQYCQGIFYECFVKQKFSVSPSGGDG